MAYELKEGSGNLFRNKTKQGSQPDMRGEVKLNDVRYEIVGWTKITQRGDKYLSLKIQVPRDKDEKQHEPHKAPSSDDSDIPF